MQNVKWIKMYTDFPNNRKIKQLMKLPNGPVCVCVWVFLMCLAGDVNENGLLYFTDELPYTDEMLADQFDLPVKVVRQALQLFEKFGMIEIIDDAFHLRNWEKYQAADRLGKIKEQDRIRAKAYRDRKRLEKKSDENNVTRHVTHHGEITDNHATDIRVKNKDIYLSLAGENSAPAREEPIVIVCGEYGNVFLTEEQLDGLKADFDDWQEKIDNLSRYMKSQGVEYADHDATIRKWAAEDAKKAKRGSGKQNAMTYDGQREYTPEEYEELELKMRMRGSEDPEKGDQNDG